MTAATIVSMLPSRAYEQTRRLAEKLAEVGFGTCLEALSVVVVSGERRQARYIECIEGRPDEDGKWGFWSSGEYLGPISDVEYAAAAVLWEIGLPCAS